jgi:ABC-type nitrate/sulfonate/bicarbonate transport system permease component
MAEMPSKPEGHSAQHAADKAPIQPMPADADKPAGQTHSSGPPDAGANACPAAPRRGMRVSLRCALPRWQAVAWGVLCIAVVGGLWWYVTQGEIVEERIFSPVILPSPQDTFGDFHSLWRDRALTRNTYASLRRVTLGFALATAVGVPLGVLCGCFPGIGAFFAPLTIMGRNIPIAALIPLTYSFFDIREKQKVMFIFIACVAFVIGDTITAIRDVSSRYIDTAYTLGANRRQVILKVLVPLAMPSVFNSLRVLFGLAFGYIMLAEMVKFGSESGGLGDIINNSQRRGLQTHILLVLMIVPLVALAIDRLLFWAQRELFPYQYGGDGVLRRALGFVLRGWEDLKYGVLSLFGRKT